MTSQERVKRLLSQQHPTFTVPTISALAQVCGITYREVASFIVGARAQGKATRTRLEQLLFCYKPDLLESKL